MTASLAAAPIARALLRTNRRGVSHADALLADDTVLAAGTRATLTIGTRSLTGTTRPGGVFAAQGGYSWVSGAGTWGATVEAQPYHDDAGVMLSAVLRDLAADAGEFGIVLDVPDRILGPSWTRPTAPASDLLDALTGREWWLADDGTTHVGARPSTAIAPAVTVDPYDQALRRAVVQLGDDDIAAFLPGATLTAQGLPAPLTIGQVDVAVTGDRIGVTLWGEAGPAELLARIVDHLTGWRRYLQVAPFTVATANADGTVAVQPADARAAALPDAPALALAFGVPGVSATLQRGSPALVVWPGGDPGSPLVLGYPAGVLPEVVTLAAASAINIGGMGAAALTLWAPLLAWISGAITACAGHGITLPPAPTAATTIAKGV